MHNSAIVRINQCGIGTSVVFTDKTAMDSYVKYVAGVAERRFPLINGGYLEGETTEQVIDERGYPIIDMVPCEIPGELRETPRMVTYPWLRLKP